ncbi:MAG: serine/threonine protein kinase, partial [Planctomycetes bacterium]|nr:serine/threonine protein kinase [Planctomycetota bacterium]
MDCSREQFLANLAASGLLAAAEVTALEQTVPPDQRPRTGTELAQFLVRRGKLTAFQASHVLHGKTQGLVFGDYVILDKLGHGGMGAVLKARHRRMDRLVAVKRILSTQLKSPDAVQRFHREVKAAARLTHPNIVIAHDAGQHAGVHYLVMEYVEGQDLATLVQHHGRLPVLQAVQCVLQAARGLEYAHAQGVIHRDIKPSNLLLSTSGVVKILDMGLARTDHDVEQAGAHPVATLTETGQVMGTCHYMAPEQILDTHEADHRSDIYSLGCTLYQLVTGHPPYAGRTRMQVLLAHRDAAIPSLQAHRTDVSQVLDAIFQRMVAKRPDARYQSMNEVIAALES